MADIIDLGYLSLDRCGRGYSLIIGHATHLLNQTTFPVSDDYSHNR